MPDDAAAEPTERRDGLGADDDVVVAWTRRCGIRDGVPSSVLSSDSDDPCRETGLEPARLNGLEFGLDALREPPGVRLARVGTAGLRGVWIRPAIPKLDSLSLRESGVEADREDFDGRDIATERCERSRT